MLIFADFFEIVNMFLYKKINLNLSGDTGSFKDALQILKLAIEWRHELFCDKVLEEIEKEKSTLNFLRKFVPYLWVVKTCEGDFAGFVYLYDVIFDGSRIDVCHISVCMRRKYWGTGVLAIAADFLNYIFEKYKIRKMKAECFSTNPNATKLLRDLGFVLEGKFKDETKIRGKMADLKVFSKFRG